MPKLEPNDFVELEGALTALRTANSQDNSKSARVKNWFQKRTGLLVAVSFITEAKQIGNRLKEQRSKTAPFTLLFSESTNISDRALKALDRYSYPGLRAVFLFVRENGKYRLRSIAKNGENDEFIEQIVQHYQQIASVEVVPIPKPQVITWNAGGGTGKENVVDPDWDDGELPEDDLVFTAVRDAKSDGYAGAILVGPPGTGKSRYAFKIAKAIVEGDMDRIRLVQFHPSYQYEDFVQGYVPTAQSFERQWKVFGRLCKTAAEKLDLQHVLVIDEFSRSDTARVFGEALTYIEMDKRGRPFLLASGDEMEIPPNIFIVATMNPWDRGVDDVDIALERRFAEIYVPPSETGLADILASSELSVDAKEGVLKFFASVQAIDNQYCHIGHAYFRHARDEGSLRRLWRFRLNPFFRRACRADKVQLQKIENAWRQLVSAPLDAAQAASGAATQNEGEEVSTTATESGSTAVPDSGAVGASTPDAS